MTRYGLGPDKWATAWLLTRYADPGATLTVVARDQRIPSGATPFDHPDAELRRADGRVAFQVVRSRFGVDDPVVDRLAEIVHEIEVAFWAGEPSPQAAAVERGFRRLQKRNGRDAVSAACYLEFFDSVEKALRSHPEGERFSSDALVQRCARSSVRDGDDGGGARAPVREVALGELLDAMRAGKEVVFVDVREPGEFRETHIPGAINLPMREVDAEAASELGDADYVVSYCVKDFRGFEMAKLLKRSGVRNSVIMNPYGIKGWVASGLPVAGAEALTEATARQRLAQCLQASRCRGEK